MDDFEEEKLKKNPYNRKPISCSNEFRLDIYLNNFVRKGRGGDCGVAKVLHTDRPSDEKGCKGAFAPKKID